MYRMGKRPARAAVLLLSLCLAGLLVHFGAANLFPPVPTFGTEWIDTGGNNAASHAAGEEAFILPEFSSLMNPLHSLRLACPKLLVVASFPHLPLVPPPISA
jgi:hypothetical protein